MKLAVVGTGYVGLVVGACFAENGNDVVCVDSDAVKVDSLQQGRLPIYEPGLGELVARNGAEKRLRFTTELAPAVASAQVVFIAVGTPPGEDGSADLTHVLAVARDLARAITGYTVIVTKSTVPVGTAARLREVVGLETAHPFSVVSNPELLKQGAAIDDFNRLVRDLADAGRTVLLVTHDVYGACHVADRIHLLHKGELVGGFDRPSGMDRIDTEAVHAAFSRAAA